MRVLFVGNYRGNSGPNNVNKSMIESCEGRFNYIKSQNKYLQYIEVLLKILFCKVVVISGISGIGLFSIKLSKKFNKKSVYIIHGCVAYEAKINELKNMDSAIQAEEKLLKFADLVLPVSKKFSEWMKVRYPQYAHKIKYLFNGVNKQVYENNCDKKHGYIVAVGGDRQIKNNLTLSKAVSRLNGKVKLEVYGRIHNGIPKDIGLYTKYMNVVPNEEFLEKLKSAQIFVLNSILETFSISVIEALNFGCDVLVTNAAGVTDLLDLEENDIIFDPMNEEEIARKIEYLLLHPNNKRIYSKINWDEISCEKQIERLINLCNELAEQ